MKSGGRQRRQRFAPAVSEFRETMQQHNARPLRGLKSRLEHMHVEPVDVLEHARSDRRRWLAMIEM
jgi:hypothetical protein